MVMEVSDECKDEFKKLKEEKTFRFIVFKIDFEAKEFTVEKLGGRDEKYVDFVPDLPKEGCRYGVYDFEFTADDESQKRKIFFFAWYPEKCSVQEKMAYASAKDTIKGKLDGVDFELQATDSSEMDINVIMDLADK